MSDVKRRLVDDGVSETALESTLEDIEQTSRSICKEYGQRLDDPQSIEAIQNEVLSIVVELGDDLEGNSLKDQFERLIEDFADPESSRARTNVVYAISALSNSPEDTPDELLNVSKAVIADNYQ